MVKLDRSMKTSQIFSCVCDIQNEKQAEEFLNELASIKMERETLSGGYLDRKEAWEKSLADVKEFISENEESLQVSRKELLSWFKKAKNRFGPIKESVFDCFGEKGKRIRKKKKSHVVDTYFQEPRQIEL